MDVSGGVTTIGSVARNRSGTSGIHGTAGRADRDQLLVERVLHVQRRGSCIDVAEAQVRPPGSHLRRHSIGLLRVKHLNGDARVETTERADPAHERLDHERRQRDDRQPTGAQPENLGGRESCIGGVVDRPASGGLEGATRRRQPNAAPDAIEQVDAQLSLERPDALRQGGLGDVKRLGGAGEPAVVDDGKHVLELPELRRNLRVR